MKSKNKSIREEEEEKRVREEESVGEEKEEDLRMDEEEEGVMEDEEEDNQKLVFKAPDFKQSKESVGLTGKGSCQVAPTMDGLTMATFKFPLSCCTTTSPKALV